MQVREIFSRFDSNIDSVSSRKIRCDLCPFPRYFILEDLHSRIDFRIARWVVVRHDEDVARLKIPERNEIFGDPAGSKKDYFRFGCYTVLGKPMPTCRVFILDPPNVRQRTIHQAVIAGEAEAGGHWAGNDRPVVYVGDNCVSCVQRVFEST